MKNFNSGSLRVLVLLCAILAPSVALAGTWVVENNPLGPGYVVTDHETGTIRTKGKKAAKKIAKILNSTGFVDPGTGPCHNPTPGVLC